MSEIVDVAFYTGLGMIGYATGCVLGAGILLVAAALATALLASGGDDE